MNRVAELPRGRHYVPMLTTRLLGPGDEQILVMLAEEEQEFGLDDDEPSRPLDPSSASEYLSDPNVAHWVTQSGAEVVGHLMCLVERRRALPSHQLLLYDLGVREGWRRRGVGRELVAAMRSWMGERGLADVWVVADGREAAAFYRALGFTATQGELECLELSLG